MDSLHNNEFMMHFQKDNDVFSKINNLTSCYQILQTNLNQCYTERYWSVSYKIYKQYYVIIHCYQWFSDLKFPSYTIHFSSLAKPIFVFKSRKT